MIEIVSEFIIQPEAQAEFELSFGPGGGWSRLFARQPGFKGMSVLRETANRQRYLVVEVWETEEDRSRALAASAAEYTALASRLDEWVEATNRLGVFRLLAEASVRPHPSAGRAKAGGGGRSPRS